MRALLISLLALLSLHAAGASTLAGCALALDRGEFALASREAESFLVADPGSVEARVLLARALMGLNDGPGALKHLDAALRIQPGNLDALYYLTKLAAILSQQQFALVVSGAPGSARAHQVQAEALEAQGDSAGAEREYLEALKKRPGTAYVMNALGDLKRHQRLYRDALVWYNRVLEKDPRNYTALYGVGACHRFLRLPQDGISFFRRALQSDPSAMAAKMALGEALLLNQRVSEAIPLLEEAAKADPGYRRLQYLLARAYKAAGNEKGAALALERYRRLPAPPYETDSSGMGGP
jgi:tetratricopeptide (TPR) repeat protein